MLRQVEIGAESTLDVLQAKLRHVEARIGEIADIAADGTEDPKITIATANNRSTVPPNSLVIVLGSGPVPAGKSLALAGTAWVAGRKEVVAIYR